MYEQHRGMYSNRSTSFSYAQEAVIESLSEKEKNIFYELDYDTQMELLGMAEDMSVGSVSKNILSSDSYARNTYSNNNYDNSNYAGDSLSDSVNAHLSGNSLNYNYLNDNHLNDNYLNDTHLNENYINGMSARNQTSKTNPSGKSASIVKHKRMTRKYIKAQSDALSNMLRTATSSYSGINSGSYVSVQSGIYGGSTYSDSYSGTYDETTREGLQRASQGSRAIGDTLKSTSQDIARNSQRISSSLKKAKNRSNIAVSKAAGIKKLTTERQIAKHSAQGTEKLARTTEKSFKTFVKLMKRVIPGAKGPMLAIFIAGFGFIAIIVSVLAGVVGMAGGAASDGGGAYVADVSELVRSYEPKVRESCEKYGIPEYVELALAVIQQESSGTPPDIMQAEQSPYNKNPPIDTVDESIDCGIQELRDVLKSASVQSPSDITRISLALQGYNYGNGYIPWAIGKDGGYTAENAAAFSEMMKIKYGYRIYGDPDYVPHVLRYYKAVGGAAVSNESAQKILKELMENNEATPQVWNMIRTGASLVGLVTYSMDGRQDDGRDNPTVLDCSSFTAWAFRKSGYKKVPYASTTETFKTSGAFKTISASELKPGDIGLKSSSAGTGGENHVGIYCGTLKDGRKVWIHCTSSSGTSLTGNRSGVMFGAYTNFTFFRRYVG